MIDPKKIAIAAVALLVTMQAWFNTEVFRHALRTNEAVGKLAQDVAVLQAQQENATANRGRPAVLGHYP